MTTTIKDPIDFTRNYCDFSNPNHVWLMKGISRNKDNHGEYHKFFRRMVLTCPEDIVECYNEIKAHGNQATTIYRIYLSLNARDVVKTNFNFAKQLIDIAHGVSIGQADMLVKSKKISSEWKTELEQKHNRGTKRILIDVDDPSIFNDVVYFVENELPTECVHAIRETPNGFAISVEACDTRELLLKFKEKEIDIQRDSMLFLEQYKGEKQ
jgi:hypothetical protein